MKPIAPVVLLLVLFACDYEPNGENFVVRPQPDDTGLSVELTDTSDTLFVFGNAEIRYHSITKGKPVKWFRAFLNGEEFGIHNLESASVYLYTHNYNNGCHTLKIELILSSGTGSLAEIKDVEEHRIERTYVLCIDNARPDRIDIRTVKRIDGTLELTWEKYSRHNFQRYKIFAYYYRQFEHQFYPHWVKEITDQETTSLRDSTFIGGQLMYQISVIGANQESDVTEKVFNDPYDPTPSWEWVGQNIKLTWPRTKYYNNFSSYIVAFSYNSSDERTFTITNVNDTTFTLDPQLEFAVTKQISIIANPFAPDYYHQQTVYGYSGDIYLGQSFPWYDADIYEDVTIYNAALNKYFTLQRGLKTELIRINAASHEIEQAFEIDPKSDIRMSDNGQYLYVSRADNFTRLDALTFSVIQTYNVSTLCGPSGGDNWKSSISNNNRLALTNAGGSYVLDMNGFSIVQQWLFDSKPIEISQTGNFVIRGSDVLKWNSTQYVLAGTTGGTKQRIFIQNDAKVLLDKIDHVEVLNLNTMSIERTITLEQGHNLRYDPVSDLLGAITDPYTSAPHRFYLYSLNSNQKVKDFPVAGGIVLMNNSLVTPGHILPLSYYYP